MVDLVFQSRRSAQMFYTLNRRPRQAPIQDSNSTLKPQPQANRELVAKHQQVNTPEEATHQPLLLATENRPSPALDYLNRRPLQEQPPELEHQGVATRKPTRKSRFRRQATQLPLTPDTEISHPQEQDWTPRRKRARKSRCKISEIRPTHFQCQADSLRVRQISNVPRTPPQASPL